MPGPAEQGWVEFGRFGRPQGLQGDVRFWPHNAESPLLAAGRTIRVGAEAEAAREYRVERVRRDPRGPIIRLEGMADRTAAESLNGMTWFEARADFPPTSDDEYYIVDLVGLTVRTEAGRTLGRIDAVWQHGGADVLVVHDADGHEVLVPAVEDFVVRVDVSAGEVIVRAVAGLTEDGA